MSSKQQPQQRNDYAEEEILVVRPPPPKRPHQPSLKKRIHFPCSFFTLESTAYSEGLTAIVFHRTHCFIQTKIKTSIIQYVQPPIQSIFS